MSGLEDRFVASDRGALPPLERIDRMRARSWALQILYRWESEAGDVDLEQAMLNTFRARRVSKRRMPIVRNHIRRVSDNLVELDEVLSGAVDNWRLDRLSRIDRSILRLSASEILFDEETPPRVSIKEGIRLAGQYGGPSSPRFVNGVLDAVLRRSSRSS